MFLNTFRYTAGDVDCQFCTRYSGKREAPCQDCPWLTERMEAGAVRYEEAARRVTHSLYKPETEGLAARVTAAVQKYPDTFFVEPGHSQRMEDVKIRVGLRRRRDTAAFGLILNALLIARYGTAAMNLRR